MADYDFHQLSPPDLEILARDLLQAHWAITLESFKNGKDAGIDLRYAAAQGKIIVQCKHYIRTGLTGLLRDLKKEAVKVRHLQPTRYVLVTSVPLSPADKTAIIGIIGGDVLVPGDVIGQQGLNDLLGQYPEIEGKHFKLWLASRAVLDRVLHNAAITRSEFKVKRVYQDARRYVQSDAYRRALKMLGDQGVVILAGPPGVGKTILANLLLYEHLEKGYRAVIILRDIEEGQNLFQEGERQIFYFDDFMGTTFLGDRAFSLTGNDDRVLLDFIAMVRATPKARFILTTREHIYAQAMGKSERLRHFDLDDLRVFPRMPDYSFTQKARILYNHLYFSDLPPEYQDELLRDDFYLKIIKHEKFNPRIIEWLSSYRRVRKIPSKQYRQFVEGLLKDPSEIWRHAYEQEISEAGRTMLLTLFSFGGKVGGIRLKSGFAALHGERARQYGFPTRAEDFRAALREVAGTFIKPWGTHGVEVIDPSVLDLLNMVIREAPENAADVIAGAVSFDQIEHIWSFAKAVNGAPVVTSISQQGDRLVNSVGQRMLDRRRIDHGKGSVSYYGATYERRLAVVIDMADRMPTSRFSDLIEPLFDRLFEEWRSESPQIIDTVVVLRATDRIRSMSSDEIEKRQAVIRGALLTEIRSGCRSDELREVISILDASDASNHTMIDATRTAFDVYRRSHFAEDLRECRSRDQFDGLIEDLELFKEELGVNVDRLLEQVQEGKDEFEAHEEARADHMLDEWKERRHDERDGDRSVSDMFGSLRDDRD
jgi:Restriction endonuclease